jgi:hypothetical protein
MRLYAQCKKRSYFRKIVTNHSCLSILGEPIAHCYKMYAAEHFSIGGCLMVSKAKSAHPLHHKRVLIII